MLRVIELVQSTTDGHKKNFKIKAKTTVNKPTGNELSADDIKLEFFKKNGTKRFHTDTILHQLKKDQDVTADVVIANLGASLSQPDEMGVLYKSLAQILKGLRSDHKFVLFKTSISDPNKIMKTNKPLSREAQKDIMSMKIQPEVNLHTAKEWDENSLKKVVNDSEIDQDIINGKEITAKTILDGESPFLCILQKIPFINNSDITGELLGMTETEYKEKQQQFICNFVNKLINLKPGIFAKAETTEATTSAA